MPEGKALVMRRIIGFGKSRANRTGRDVVLKAYKPLVARDLREVERKRRGMPNFRPHPGRIPRRRGASYY
ncbi:hypothetical protein GCM10010319_63660 [Streptomyces blastmyceticus]|uniref:Uncharacterized protein n=1 Tax=Streptomyces blastmyceticus TaxID=68180 RepID=A0ABN0XY24_9ACTN